LISASGLIDNEISDSELDALTAPHPFSIMIGKKIGIHNGAHFFTIGQRKGINIGGHKEPLFVIGTDIEKNIIYVGEGQDHPGLHRKGLFIGAGDVHWIREDKKMEAGEYRDYEVRIRYRQPLQKARLFMREKGLYLNFNRQQRGVAPGQFAAWYENEEVIGSGVINH
jgi:tRNA-specific 2-thiouridylase